MPLSSVRFVGINLDCLGCGFVPTLGPWVSLYGPLTACENAGFPWSIESIGIVWNSAVSHARTISQARWNRVASAEGLYFPNRSQIASSPTLNPSQVQELRTNPSLFVPSPIRAPQGSQRFSQTGEVWWAAARYTMGPGGASKMLRGLGLQVSFTAMDSWTKDDSSHRGAISRKSPPGGKSDQVACCEPVGPCWSELFIFIGPPSNSLL